MGALSFLDPTDRDSLIRRGGRAIDPTTPEGQRNLLYGGTMGTAAIANETLGDPMNFQGRIDARKKELEARAKKGDAEAQMELEREYFRELAGKYRDVAGSPETTQRADDLYTRDMQPEIDRGMYDATSATARGYSSRGMGQSGYSTNAQSQAIQAAAQERVRARSRALDIATAEGRSSLLGEAQVRGMGTGLTTQMYSAALAQHQAALAREAAERAEYRNLLAGVGGRVAGAMIGGPAGAAGAGAAVDAGGYDLGPIESPQYLDDDMYLYG